MKAIIKRELKNYLKNPILWVGLVIVVFGMFKQLSPYLQIHYFNSDKEIQDIHVESPQDGEITDGYIPATPDQQKEMAFEVIRESLVNDLEYSEDKADEIIGNMKDMTVPEACEYLKKFKYNGAIYTFEDKRYRQGTMEEVNGYLNEKFKEHSFSFYFSRKFADFAGLFMYFFSTVLFAFLFLRDTKKDTYELLHTKPVRPWQYVLGKMGGGFLVALLVLGVLNLIFGTLCMLHAGNAGFPANVMDMLYATCIYVLPNMLMVIAVYTIVALLFKNPLPAAPLLILYMVYSNMIQRVIGSDGSERYIGRPLAIMVRFPGQFFDTTPPPFVLLNQTFLILVSAVIIILAITIWKRRRVY